LEEARRQADYAASEEQRLHDLWWNIGHVSQTVSRVNGHYDSENARYNEWQTAITTARNSRENARGLASLYQAAAASTEATRDFAMFSGKQYAGLEIWDCGK
jgi:hypothetical protein